MEVEIMHCGEENFGSDGKGNFIIASAFVLLMVFWIGCIIGSCIGEGAGERRTRNEAVIAQHGQYYMDDYGAKQWRWK